MGDNLLEEAEELAERREKCKIKLQKRLNVDVEEVTRSLVVATLSKINHVS